MVVVWLGVGLGVLLTGLERVLIVAIKGIAPGRKPRHDRGGCDEASRGFGSLEEGRTVPKGGEGGRQPHGVGSEAEPWEYGNVCESESESESRSCRAYARQHSEPLQAMDRGHRKVPPRL